MTWLAIWHISYAKVGVGHFPQIELTILQDNLTQQDLM